MPGLDSFAALNVMEYLSQLGAMGHTIIASIHQPRADIFNKFNKVLPPTNPSPSHSLLHPCPPRCIVGLLKTTGTLLADDTVQLFWR